jgi:hypothetical protein
VQLQPAVHGAAAPFGGARNVCSAVCRGRGSAAHVAVGSHFALEAKSGTPLLAVAGEMPADMGAKTPWVFSHKGADGQVDPSPGPSFGPGTSTTVASVPRCTLPPLSPLPPSRTQAWIMSLPVTFGEKSYPIFYFYGSVPESAISLSVKEQAP